MTSSKVSLGQRSEVLARLRNVKMARSAHSYVRGNTVKFYEWLENGSGKALPSGPDVWICGDCHLGNLGPVASAEGDIDIQIRDLDQTVIGAPAHDLVRLGLSLAMAVRGSDLPGVITVAILEEMIKGLEWSLGLRQAVKTLLTVRCKRIDGLDNFSAE